MDDLLQRAAEEIRILRRQNEVLRAKVDTMDLMATFLMTRPHLPGQGMAEDVAWLLDKKAQELRDHDARAGASEIAATKSA